VHALSALGVGVGILAGEESLAEAAVELEDASLLASRARDEHRADEREEDREGAVASTARRRVRGEEELHRVA
jgi:hypothetical protein